MTDTNFLQKEKKEKPPVQERPEQPLGPELIESEEVLEEKEVLETEKEREAERQRPAAGKPLQQDEQEELNVLKEVDRLSELKFEGRKIEHLMQLAQSKGVDFAIEVAKKTNDACLLDLFHDKIIEKGLHKGIE